MAPSQTMRRISMESDPPIRVEFSSLASSSEVLFRGLI